MSFQFSLDEILLLFISSEVIFDHVTMRITSVTIFFSGPFNLLIMNHVHDFCFVVVVCVQIASAKTSTKFRSQNFFQEKQNVKVFLPNSTRGLRCGLRQRVSCFGFYCSLTDLKILLSSLSSAIHFKYTL